MPSDETIKTTSRDGSHGWRRLVGAVVMAAGGLILAAFALLAGVVALTFVEWRNALDGLASVALVTAPPIFVGLLLSLLGRWIYGGWRTDRPIRSAASIVLPVAGIIAAFAAIVLFMMALFNETGRGGAWAVGQFVVSILASLATVAIGRLMKPRYIGD